MAFPLACALLAATWLLLRHFARNGAGAGTGPTCWAALPLDGLPILLGWLALLSVTRRPVLSAIGIAAAGAGLALADHAKRATLREPLVFADRAEGIEVIRHPGLYIPFAGPLIVAGILAATTLLVGLLAWLEPSAAHPSPFVVLPLCVLAFIVPGLRPILPWLADRYRALGPTTEPGPDMRRFGFLATLVMHATLAKDERPARQANARGVPDGPIPRAGGTSGPVVLLQLESFFDPRRLGPVIPSGLLPSFDRLRAEAALSGRLDVPCWGANTVRTEFCTLTGIPIAEAGLDRFNPYERFAQALAGPSLSSPGASLPSLARQMQRAGYRTICVHPFDIRFYGRNRVLPRLGFDRIVGPEAFRGAPRAGAYVADEAVAAEIVRLLHAEGPDVFIFAITMGNHGPWDSPGRHSPTASAIPDTLPEAAILRLYLDGIGDTDRLIGHVHAAMAGQPGLLALYGDHQPSLPGAFAALGLPDENTDYLIWQHAAPPGHRRDVAAHDLPTLILRQLASMDAPAPDLP